MTRLHRDPLRILLKRLNAYLEQEAPPLHLVRDAAAGIAAYCEEALAAKPKKIPPRIGT